MKYLTLLFALLSFLPTAAVHAADGTYGMPGGGTVTVDPGTNRATVTRNGVSAPLWDGTHRMDDGSILIIRQGVVVPNVTELGARQAPAAEEGEHWQVEQIVGFSPCEKLVRRVCGRKDECANTEPCDLARQLLQMEAQEREDSSSRSLTTYTSSRCQGVDSDPGLFPDCKLKAPQD
ncbi:MAG: hypothetical protein R3F42_07910 [Pseudomonadota bacterium]